MKVARTVVTEPKTRPISGSAMFVGVMIMYICSHLSKLCVDIVGAFRLGRV